VSIVVNIVQTTHAHLAWNPDAGCMAAVARLKIKPRVTHNDETPMQGIMNGDQKEILAEDVHPLHINITKHVIIMTLRPLAHWLSSSISTAVSVQHETAINIQKQTGQKRLTLVQDLTRK
jgi:hypothetical protein